MARLASSGIPSILFLTALSACGQQTSDPPEWSPVRAARYLDQRSEWWFAFPKAARDHDTFCVSCHTIAPIALSRPALRGPLAEASTPPNEQKILANVLKRVRLWREVE